MPRSAGLPFSTRILSPLARIMARGRRLEPGPGVLVRMAVPGSSQSAWWVRRPDGSIAALVGLRPNRRGAADLTVVALRPGEDLGLIVAAIRELMPIARDELGIRCIIGQRVRDRASRLTIRADGDGFDVVSEQPESHVRRWRASASQVRTRAAT